MVFSWVGFGLRWFHRVVLNFGMSTVVNVVNISKWWCALYSSYTKWYTNCQELLYARLVVHLLASAVASPARVGTCDRSRQGGIPGINSIHPDTWHAYMSLVHIYSTFQDKWIGTTILFIRDSVRIYIRFINSNESVCLFACSVSSRSAIINSDSYCVSSGFNHQNTN